MSGQSRVLTGTGRVMGASEATSVQLAMRRRHRNLNQIPAQERHLMLTFTVATSHNTVATSQNVCQRDDHAAEPACSAPLRCAHQQARRHSTGRASAGPSAVQSSHRGRLRIATCSAARGIANVSCTRAVLGVCRAKVVLERRARDRRRKPALLLQWPRTTNRPHRYRIPKRRALHVTNEPSWTRRRGRPGPAPAESSAASAAAET